MKILKFGSHTFAAMTALMLFACTVNNDTPTEVKTTPVFTPAKDVILSYAHSATGATNYKLDWIEKNGSTYAVKTNQIVVDPSGGLYSPTFSDTYILVVNSTATGSLLAYKRSDFSLAGQISVGSYPQEMAISGNTAYIAAGTGVVKRVDISNLPTLTALSDITVGAKPTALRKLNGKIYVGNQDWDAQVQSSVSVIDPSTNTVTSTITTGPNNTDIGFDGTRIWTQNVSWYAPPTYACQNSSTLTYAPISTYVPVSVATPAGYSSSSDCSKGGLGFNSTTGFVALRHTSGNFHLFSITGTTLNSSAVDSTNQYKFIGAGSTYLYKIHNGNGSTSNLTTIIEDMNGAVQTTQTLTKDDPYRMYFFANQ